MEKEILNLSKDQARSVVSEQYYVDSDGNDVDFELISDEIESQSRWETYHGIIVKRKSDSKYFESGYSIGSTEYQDVRPYEHSDPVFTQIFPHMALVTGYSDKPVSLTIERVAHMRKMAIDTLELTKGIPRSKPNPSLDTLEELAGYIIELTNE